MPDEEGRRRAAANATTFAEAGESRSPPAPYVIMFAWCEVCARQVRMMTPAQAARQTAVSQSTIYRWAVADKIHSAQTARGKLVCFDSLYSTKA